MNCAELRASRTDAVATAKILSAPRASAIERKRLMQSAARSIAEAESCSCRSVSCPSRTTSFSRDSTAKESLAAASTTTSLIEFEPTSMAAIFMTQVSKLLSLQGRVWLPPALQAGQLPLCSGFRQKLHSPQRAPLIVVARPQLAAPGVTRRLL